LREKSRFRAHLDGGPFERDYVPIYVADSYRGHLWVYRDVTERQRSRRRLRDALAEQALKMARRTKESMTLFFIDLDGMKSINDRHGHEAGDDALVETAQLLTQTFRESDSVARLGGDEFVVLAAGCCATGGEICERRMATNLAECNLRSKRSFRIAISVGTAPRTGDDMEITQETLLRRSDSAMYRAKRRPAAQRRRAIRIPTTTSAAPGTR
jgi:diguanylate cyclase (GGDEF)-like protein